MDTTNPIYFELIDFIAAGTTPEKVIGFRPSPKVQQRVEELVVKEKDSELDLEERSESDYFFQLEHILRIAKARAQQILIRAS